MSIPTLLVFSGGEVHKRLVGAKGKAQLLQELDEFLVSVPLTPGQHGEAIRDLQRRLGGAGFAPVGAEAGSFDAPTEAAVRAFQRDRGLHDHGTLRRADVARPRRGVVAARRPAAASCSLRTCAATTSARCSRCSAGSASTAGASTASSGRPRPGRWRTSSATAASTSTASAARRRRGPRGQQRADRQRAGRGDDPRARAARPRRRVRAAICASSSASSAGSAPLVRSVAHDLRSNGARVIAVDELDPSRQAAAANRYAASVYVGFEPQADPAATVAYYSTDGFESPAASRWPSASRGRSRRPARSARRRRPGCACRCCARRG